MSGILGWLWGSEEPVDSQQSIDIARKEGEVLAGYGAAQLISKDILKQGRKGLRKAEEPIERIHILSAQPATLSPTTNLSLIKRSWLGVTADVLAEAISKLRRTETAVHTEFKPKSAVLQELLATRPRID